MRREGYSSCLVNRVRKLAGGVANNLITCPLASFFSTWSKHLGSIYCPLYGVTRCPLWRVPNERKSMEKQSGPKSLSVISQVSAVEECPAGFHCIFYICPRLHY